MAWTTPKTWADGDIPDADDLNTHIRDNMNVLSTHAHSGAAGDGSAALAPISTVTFADQGSTPSAPGSSKVNLFSESETLKVREGASGAAVAIALANHTHTIASSTETKASLGTVALTSTTYTNTTTATFTPTDSTGSAKYVSVHFGSAGYRNITGNTNTLHIRLLKAGSQTVEVSAALGGSVGDGVTVHTSIVYVSPAADSTTFAVEHKKSGTGSEITMFGLGTIVREVRCQ